MSLIDVILPKRYRNSRVLFEQNLDAWRQATEQAFSTLFLNLTQLRKDTFSAGYDYNNNGDQTLPTSLQDLIGGFSGGTSLILGTTSITFTINSAAPGNLILSAFGLTAPRTFTFPDASGVVVSNNATQTLTAKTLTSPTITNPTITGTVAGGATYSSVTLTTPTIASFVNATHNHESASGGGQLNAANVFSAGLVPVDRGGTGAGTFAIHGVILGNTTGALSITAAGTTGTVLRGQTGADPIFGQVVLTTDVTGVLPFANGGTGLGAPLTAGSVVFSDGVSFDQDNANFFWDNTNNRFGVHTNAPQFPIHLLSSVATPTYIAVQNTGAEAVGYRMINSTAEWLLRINGTQIELNDIVAGATSFTITPVGGTNLMSVNSRFQFRPVPFSTFTVTVGTATQATTNSIKTAVITGTLDATGDVSFTLPTGLTIYGMLISNEDASGSGIYRVSDYISYSDAGSNLYTPSSGVFQWFSNNNDYPNCAFNMIIWYT